jgi:hypothetical protein
VSAFWKTREVPRNWPDPLSELPQTEIITPEDRVVEGMIPIATNGGMKSLVTPGWHLIVHQKLGEQLYDWVHDPGESTNRVAEPRNYSIRVSLAEEMSARTKPSH